MVESAGSLKKHEEGKEKSSEKFPCPCDKRIGETSGQCFHLLVDDCPLFAKANTNRKKEDPDE